MRGRGVESVFTHYFYRNGKYPFCGSFNTFVIGKPFCCIYADASNEGRFVFLVFLHTIFIIDTVKKKS